MVYQDSKTPDAWSSPIHRVTGFSFADSTAVLAASAVNAAAFPGTGLGPCW